MSEEFRDKWPEMRMKHLELIQSAITRMGNNSAALKGYSIAMNAAIITVVAATSNGEIIFYALPMLLAFSVLDAAYLSLEKGFRNQYDAVRESAFDQKPDFVITANYSEKIVSYFGWSVSGFCGAMAIIMIGIACAV